jgi:hypothetical protein
MAVKRNMRYRHWLQEQLVPLDVQLQLWPPVHNLSQPPAAHCCLKRSGWVFLNFEYCISS